MFGGLNQLNLQNNNETKQNKTAEHWKHKRASVDLCMATFVLDKLNMYIITETQSSVIIKEHHGGHAGTHKCTSQFRGVNANGFTPSWWVHTEHSKQNSFSMRGIPGLLLTWARYGHFKWAFKDNFNEKHLNAAVSHLRHPFEAKQIHRNCLPHALRKFMACQSPALTAASTVAWERRSLTNRRGFQTWPQGLLRLVVSLLGSQLASSFPSVTPAIVTQWGDY